MVKDSILYKQLSTVSPDSFYKKQEEVTLRFYQTPKALFTNSFYDGLSLGPKLMYSVLRDRLDLSIKNNWTDKYGYIYLIFSGDELTNLLKIGKNTVTRYKRKLIRYRLIIEIRIGQGKPNRLYVLKPRVSNNGDEEIKAVDNSILNPQNGDSRIPKTGILDSPKRGCIDTNVNDTDLNNVNKNAISNKKKKRSPEKEALAKYIAEQLGDNNSLGFFRKVVDLMPENLIFQALSEVKDTHLTGKIKKSKGALFTAVIQSKAKEHNINL